jgi:hypothetical protein
MSSAYVNQEAGNKPYKNNMKTFAERSKSYIKRPSKSHLIDYNKVKKNVKYDMKFIQKNDKEKNLDPDSIVKFQNT